MRRKLRMATMVLIGAVLVTTLSSGQEGNVYEQITAPDRLQRQKAAKEIVATRKRENDALVEAAKTLLASDRRRDAAEVVRTIGVLRVDEAVPLLVAELLFDPRKRDDGLPSPAPGRAFTWEDQRPCAAALVRIGVVGVPTLLGEAARTNSAEYVREAARVLKEILGAQCAAQYVATAVEREPESMREGLQKLRDAVLSGS